MSETSGRIPLKCFKADSLRFDDGSEIVRIKTGDHDLEILVRDGAAEEVRYQPRDPAECDESARIEDLRQRARAASERARIEPAGERKPNRWELATKFARTMYSRVLEGAVPLAVLDHRAACCHGTNLAGERVSAPCRFRYESEAGGVFCKSCGCPEWKLADLTVDPENPGRSKLAFPGLDCPIGRFSAVNGERSRSRKREAVSHG